MSISIQAKGLHKAFGGLEVLKDVSFVVWYGEILAILGPNGAGKTTIINILSTLLPQDSGTVSINSYDTLTQAGQVRANIGLSGQFAAVDEYLSGRENMRLIGRLYHLDSAVVKLRVDELIQEFDLASVAERPVRTYSGGMKRRLDLAMSLVADPPILFLDEPTTGLDPRSRLSLWNMIKDLASGGRTILLTTQYMEEADFLADNVIVIDHGTVIAEGSPGKLKADAGAAKLEITFKTAEDMKRAAAMFLDTTIDEPNLTVTMPAQYGIESLHAKIGHLETFGIWPETAALRRPTLDDVFLSLTGHETEHQQEAQNE
jgi:ABC-2 type transport system ATP-binding protein